jgi:hypothetical protein
VDARTFIIEKQLVWARRRGNFGDGKIGAYADNGDFLGFLRDRSNDVLSIDGLWALLPGTAASGGTDAVWFSAGPDEETHGLLGIIRPAG